MSDTFVPQDDLERACWEAVRKVRSKRVRREFAAKIRADLELRRRIMTGTTTLVDEMLLKNYYVPKYLAKQQGRE